MPATLHYYEPYQTDEHFTLLANEVKEVMNRFYENLNEDPANIYNMVMSEIEKPLIESVMKFTGHNQSRAAEILGLNRGTFRKKLALYGML